MTRLAFAFGFACGAAAVYWLSRVPAQPVKPAEPVSEDERWQKRIDSLDSFYAEEKANDRLRRK